MEEVDQFDILGESKNSKEDTEINEKIEVIQPKIEKDEKMIRDAYRKIAKKNRKAIKKKKPVESGLFSKLKSVVTNFKDKIVKAYKESSEETKNMINMTVAGATLGLGYHGYSSFFNKSEQPLYRESVDLDAIIKNGELNVAKDERERIMLREKLRMETAQKNLAYAKGEIGKVDILSFANDMYIENTGLVFKSKSIPNSEKLPTNLIYNFDFTPDIARHVVSIVTKNYRVNTMDLNQYFNYYSGKWKTKFNSKIFNALLSSLMYIYDIYVNKPDQFEVNCFKINEWIGNKDIPSIISMSKILGNGVSTNFIKWMKKTSFEVFISKFKNKDSAPDYDEIKTYVSLGELEIE